MKISAFKIFLIIIISMCPFTSHGSVIEKIKKKGVLKVGVKSDYRPWGGIDCKGRNIGMEVDMGRDIAKRLGVKFKPVIVTSLFRLQKLSMKEIDLVIATMAGTYKRSKLAHLIEPPYYISGVTVLIKKDSNIKKWEDLKDCRVCLLRGAFYNRDIVEKYSIREQIYNSTVNIEKALKNGQCDGWAYDDTVLKKLLLKDSWKSYYLPLRLKYVNAWVMAVNKEYEGSDYSRFLTETVIKWHRDGFLLEREKYYGLKRSSFLDGQNKLFNIRSGKNRFLCETDKNGKLPSECLKYKIKKAKVISEKSPFFDFMKGIGIDLSFLKESYNRNLLLEGIFYTALLSISSIFFAAVSGSFIAVIRCSGFGLINFIITGISEGFRLTPPLLHLYIIFFGIGGYMKNHFGFGLDSRIVAVFCFSIYAGAAISGILETAILDYRRKNSERRIFIQVLKAFEASYENVQSNLVNLVKLAGIASVISVPEIISSTNMIVAENGNRFLIMNFLLIFYLFFVGFFIYIFKYGRRKIGSWTKKI